MQVRLADRAPRLLYPALAVSALIVVMGIIFSGGSGEDEPPSATPVPTASSTPTRTSTPDVSATSAPTDAATPPPPPQATVAPVADEGTTLASIKPWAAVVLTLALTALSGAVILLSRYSADDKKAAWTVVSAVLGFWVGVGAG